MYSRRKTDPEDTDQRIHRRRTDADAVLHLHSRIADCEESITKLLESNRDMATTLNGMVDNLGRVAEVLEAWNNAKGFWLTIKFLSAVSRIALPVLAIGGALWLFARTGVWEKP